MNKRNKNNINRKIDIQYKDSYVKNKLSTATVKRVIIDEAGMTKIQDYPVSTHIYDLAVDFKHNEAVFLGGSFEVIIGNKKKRVDYIIRKVGNIVVKVDLANGGKG